MPRPRGLPRLTRTNADLRSSVVLKLLSCLGEDLVYPPFRCEQRNTTSLASTQPKSTETHIWKPTYCLPLPKIFNCATYETSPPVVLVVTERGDGNPPVTTRLGGHRYEPISCSASDLTGRERIGADCRCTASLVGPCLASVADYDKPPPWPSRGTDGTKEVETAVGGLTLQHGAPRIPCCHLAKGNLS